MGVDVKVYALFSCLKIVESKEVMNWRNVNLERTSWDSMTSLKDYLKDSLRRCGMILKVG